MAIIKKPYEISVWDEKLGENGQKTEIKRAIIGAHDMSYIGRATSPVLTKNLNGTHTLTFQMPSKFFDSAIGEYVHNEFCDNIFNERKIKLQYDGEWYEFYVKNITENKQFKSIMYQYTCEDAFIDELSRNGYGITFDTELYNNVEEIGTFTEIILDDSIWEYDASKNWGDFTEYAEEKLFKIPVSMFSSIPGYKLNYIVDGTLTNVFSGETRKQEMGDDLSREQKIFWDNGNFDNGIPLLQQQIKNVENDGYIYVPYSCLDFCYIKTGDSNYAATQEAAIGQINGVKSYYLAPSSIDPTSLIQFIAIPPGAEVQIDEAGLLVNKDYSYVMTLKDWNECVNSNKWYNTEKNEIQDTKDVAANKMVCYDGYLEKIGDTELTFGKKISITDRTEINISEEIDQYVKVYNNSMEDFVDKEKNTTEFTSDEWDSSQDENINYRLCSSTNTRTIVPQLARNLVQNGTNMTDTSGWEVMKLFTGVNEISSSISVRVESNSTNDNEISDIQEPEGLILNTHTTPSALSNSNIEDYKTFINFGIVGQEEIITKDQTYVLYIEGEYVKQEGNSKNGYTYLKTTGDNSIKVVIGEGGYDSDGDYTISQEQRISLNALFGTYYFIRPTKNIENPYFAINPTTSTSTSTVFNLKKVIFSKAYTKGADFFEGEDIKYKYTGRDIFFSPTEWYPGINMYVKIANESDFLKEEDVFEGDVYSYNKYFRQQLQANSGEHIELKDSFMLKSYLKNSAEPNGFNPTIYTEEDVKVITDYIDLNRCKYYNSNATIKESDCKHKDSTNGVCMYQKYGYCPYRFQTQKHCRKIRTLNGEKSNRFNLTQELSKVFEIYPVYYTEHEANGKVKTDIAEENNKTYKKMRKKVFYITEKGIENKLGFKYTKNLSNISRTFDSKEIVTKLYVEDVDSELSKTGLCSIKTAEDNPSRDNYIIDFSYYTMRGLLDKNMTDADLYGIDESDMGYLKQLGYYNKKYDELSNLIINLQDESYTELTANVEVNLTGIETAQQELNKINKNLSRYAANKNNSKKTTEESDTYLNYKQKYNEQKNILLGLIEDTFMTNGNYYRQLKIKNPNWSNFKNANELLDAIMLYGFKTFKKEFLDTFLYRKYGLMGQYAEEYLQIQKWKKERAKYLEDINRISLAFYKKYEPYLKEGTWSDSNYLSDNSYYFGAKEVAKQGAIPKLTYNISVIDLSILDSDYKIDVADTTYIEDIETFGINEKTGLPNRLKVIISGITYNLDIPSENSIQVQNYTTQFEDLFQQISASVQSLTFNENIYKRSSNFTSTQNISEESLQGGLSENQLTLIETDEKNIELDSTGQSGSDINNHANKYKLSGEGLFFSNNGGQTWNVGVTPKGINADYIKVGSLDASKISIVDGEYLYFLWDKGGITAYRTPQATGDNQNYFQDFARFNKYGLSLVEDGKIRLRAGYSFNGEEGEINSEADIDKTNNIGFYLYNNKGEVIFSTESSNEVDNTQLDNNTAKISLKGEMFVTDSNIRGEEQKRAVYTYKNDYTLQNKTIDSTIRIYTSLTTEDETLSSTMNFNYDGPIVDITKDFIKKEISHIFACNVNDVNNFFITNNNTIQLTVKTSNENLKIFKISAKNKELNVINEDNEKIIYISEENGYEKLLKNYFWSNIILQDITNSSSATAYDLSSEKIFIDTKEKTHLGDIFKETIRTVLIGNKTKTSTKSYKQISIQYYDLNNNNYIINNDLVYNVDGVYYKNRTQKTETINASNLQTSLFLNNRISASLDRQMVGEYERLFSCVTADYSENQSSEKGFVSNIFSILKNGELYIGGTVCGKNGQALVNNFLIRDLPNEIKITDEFLSVKRRINEETEQEDWGLHLNFEKLYDTRTGDNLINTIVQHVEAKALISHKHQIKKLTITTDTESSKTEIKWLHLPFGYEQSGVNISMSDLIRGLLCGGEVVDLTNSNKKYKFVKAIPIFIQDNKTYEIPLECINSFTEYEGGAPDGTGTSGYSLIDPVGE